MATGIAECGCVVECYVLDGEWFVTPELEDIEITFCPQHTPKTPADDHYFVATEAGGAFMQATCRCGTHLCETGITNYTTMLAGHIQKVLHNA